MSTKTKLGSFELEQAHPDFLSLDRKKNHLLKQLTQAGLNPQFPNGITQPHPFLTDEETSTIIRDAIKTAGADTFTLDYQPRNDKTLLQWFKK